MTKTIALVGEVSSGKSSFLNSFAIGFVSSVSLQRETFQPLWYQFSKENNMDLKSLTETINECHVQNEKDRIILSDKKIKPGDLESRVSTIKQICDDKSTLPIRYGLNDFNLIDFPGLNDSEDQRGEFMKALTNRMDMIDIIFYITDAARAFVSSSEVEQFKSIQKMINEQKTASRFVDLIVIVNKFDDQFDEDLNQIYERISPKIGIPKERIFRVSSHKMMLTTAAAYNIDLFVPEYMMKTEIRKIFRNAEIIAPGSIHPSGILPPYWSDHTGGKIDGDWDGYLSFLRTYDAKYIEGLYKVLDSNYSVWEAKCLRRYDGNPVSFYSSDKKIEESLYDEIAKIKAQYEKLRLDKEVFLKKLSGTINKIITKYRSSRKILRFYLFEYLYVESIVNDEDLFINALDVLDKDTIIIFYHWFQNSLGSNLLSISKKIFQKRVYYESYYSETFQRSMWRRLQGDSFANKIMESFNKRATKKTASEHQLSVLFWLYVATTDKITLKSLDAEERIDYSLLELIDPTLPVKFRHWMNLPGTDPLKHLLFDIDQIEEVKKYYQTYQKFEHWE